MAKMKKLTKEKSVLIEEPVRKFFIRDGSIALPKDIQVNEVLDLGFNYKGRIESIRRIKE